MVRGQKTEVEVMRSKCLAQSNKDLCRFDSSRRVQVVADIDAHRPDRRLVAKPDADSIRVVRSKSAEPDLWKDVPAIVKCHQSEPLLDRKREPKFRVHDKKFAAALGHLNLAAGRRIVGIAAHSDGALWACAVEREPA